ncbi:MAG: CopD family protein [Ramlibacter sp.]
MHLLAAWMPWIKFVHLAALLAWCACLLALPALLALFPLAEGRVARRRVRAAVRFVFIALASPAAVLAVASGTALVHLTQAYAPWFFAKLTLVAAMVLFHAGCGKLVLVLRERPRSCPPGLLLATAGVPLALILGVLWLVLAQPALDLLSLPRPR